MNWLLICEIIYLLLVLTVALVVIYNTRSSVKTLAYLMIIVFFPVGGIIIYFSVGVNYRKRKMYSKKIIQNELLEEQVRRHLAEYTSKVSKEENASVRDHLGLINYLFNESNALLSDRNDIRLLLNGENKFPLVLERLRQANHHIHIEYYIFEDDDTGNAIADILIERAHAGVQVRFIYDHFGSHRLKRSLLDRMTSAGVAVYPFYKIRLFRMASRMNYRNHRKIIVIDGRTGFIGGINVSNKYVNNGIYNNKLYWRDTHIMIEGAAVYHLQYLFMADWNFCAHDRLLPDNNFFPRGESLRHSENKVVQFAASGPDYNHPTIQNALLVVIGQAQKELLITTPYFIPGEAIMQALVVAAYRGVRIRLLVPGISDSILVNAASNSFYAELLQAGVEVFKYQKGFVHAKTLVSDSNLAFVGTANMDYRSFELNFEVTAVIYDEAIAGQLTAAFRDDLTNSIRLERNHWLQRPFHIRMFEKICGLLSPLL